MAIYFRLSSNKLLFSTDSFAPFSARNSVVQFSKTDARPTHLLCRTAFLLYPRFPLLSRAFLNFFQVFFKNSCQGRGRFPRFVRGFSVYHAFSALSRGFWGFFRREVRERGRACYEGRWDTRGRRGGGRGAGARREGAGRCTPRRDEIQGRGALDDIHAG